MRAAEIKALHLEYLTTRQVSTGNGALFIPQGHEGAVDDDRPPRWFVLQELGMSFDHGPSIAATIRDLASGGNERRKTQYEGEELEAYRRLRADGVRTAQPMFDTGAGFDHFTHRPVKRRPRRSREQAGSWVPRNPNEGGRRWESEQRRAKQEAEAKQRENRHDRAARIQAKLVTALSK